MSWWWIVLMFLLNVMFMLVLIDRCGSDAILAPPACAVHFLPTNRVMSFVFNAARPKALGVRSWRSSVTCRLRVRSGVMSCILVRSDWCFIPYLGNSRQRSKTTKHVSARCRTRITTRTCCLVVSWFSTQPSPAALIPAVLDFRSCHTFV